MNFLTVHIQLSIILNNGHHLSQWLLLRTDLVPELSVKERSKKDLVLLHSNVTDTVGGVMRVFSDAVDKKMSTILKKVLDKVKLTLLVPVQGSCPVCTMQACYSNLST